MAITLGVAPRSGASVEFEFDDLGGLDAQGVGASIPAALLGNPEIFVRGVAF